MLAVAALRVAHERGVVLPSAVPLPVEAEQAALLDDWAAVLERWALGELALSGVPEDAARLRRLREALAPFGLSLTERGLRQGRSAGDLVLALSDAKHAMAARILAAEHADLGDRLRALVVVDFERAATAVAALDRALDADAGSARRLHAHLAQDPAAAATAPVLLTARSLRASAQGAQELCDWLDAEARRRGLDCTWSLVGTDSRHVLDVVGSGRDTGPGARVALVTAAFDAGVVRCLVGTRGLLGEGWNSRPCNTVLDLSGAATRTASRQLRGRPLRLDPAWPDKVAHCWDVVCVAPGYERGQSDLQRFQRRHRELWGIADEPGAAGPAPIVRGVDHVDPLLASQLATRPWREVDLAAATARSFAAVRTRERTRERWAIGAPFAGVPEPVARLRPAPSAARLRPTPDVAAAVAGAAGGRRLLGGLAALAGGAGVLGSLADPVWWAAAGAALVGLALLAGRRAARAARAARAPVTATAAYTAVGRAVRDALADGGLVHAATAERRVVATARPDGAVDLGLEAADPAAAARWVAAVRQALGPLGNPRYLVRPFRGGPPRCPRRPRAAAAHPRGPPVRAVAVAVGSVRWQS